MIASIHIAISPFTKKAMVTSTGGLAEQAAFLHFTLSAVYPDSRVHQAFAELLEAEWIQGKVLVEPDIVSKPNEGAIGLRPQTKIILPLVREEVLLRQQSRIFLSHKSVNSAMVRRFYDVLKDLGFEPWLDKEDMAAGENYDLYLCGATFRTGRSAGNPSSASHPRWSCGGTFLRIGSINATGRGTTVTPRRDGGEASRSTAARILDLWINSRSPACYLDTSQSVP